MKISDCVQDAGTGQLSHTKLWGHVGYAVMTVAFVRQSWLHGLSDMLLLTYGMIFTGGAALSKFLSLRMGGQARE